MTRERQRFAVRIDLAYLPTSHIVLPCPLKHLFLFYRKSPKEVSTHKIIPSFNSPYLFFLKKRYANNLKCNKNPSVSTISVQTIPSGNILSKRDIFQKNIIHTDRDECVSIKSLANIILFLQSFLWTKIENNFFPEKRKISPKPIASTDCAFISLRHTI